MKEKIIDGYDIIRYRRWFMQFPKSFDKLRWEDIKWLAQYYPFKPTTTFYFKMFIHFCSLKFKPLLAWHVYTRMKPIDIHLIMSNGLQRESEKYLMAWLFKPLSADEMCLNSYRLNGVNYYAPSNELINFLFGDFKWAETALTSYFKTGDKAALAIIAAALYYPSKKARRYDEVALNKRSELFKKLDMVTLKGIMLNYVACRTPIMEDNKVLFEGGSSAGDGEVLTWLDVANDMAVTAADIDNVNNILTRVMLSRLSRMKIKAAKAKK